jgi:N-acetylglucosamine-6-phosphate deacetylase
LAAIPGRVVLTLAPEMVEDAALRRLHAAGIILCAGHSAASYERMQSAIAAGVTGFTHVFNAMPPPNARDPGIVGAALSPENTWCGVIADGIHVHPAMLRLLLAARSAERIMLVSDAMSPTGSDMQSFELQGRTIHRFCGRLVDDEGTLAGADLCLMEAVRRAIQLAGVSEAQALAMASAVPAAFLGLGHRLGIIAPGYEADLVLLDAQLGVLGTWLGGHWEGEAVWA